MIPRPRSWFLFKQLLRKELRGRFIGSTFGMAWTVINPVVLMATYVFLFALVLEVQLRPGAPGATRADYVLYLVSGLFPWLAFQEALHRSSGCIVENAQVVRNTLFPTEYLPGIIVVSTSVQTAAGQVVVLVGAWALGAPPGVSALLLPALIAVQALLAFGLSALLAALGALHRDTGHILNLALVVWMFSTPIFYSTSMLPDALPAGFETIIMANPMTHLMDGYRAALLGMDMSTNWGAAYLVAFSASMAMIGRTTLRRLEPRFSDVV